MVACIGFLNQWLYQNPDAFYDVTVGSNKIGRGGGVLTQGFDCAKGWDPVTGKAPPTPLPSQPPPAGGLAFVFVALGSRCHCAWHAPTNTSRVLDAGLRVAGLGTPKFSLLLAAALKAP